MKEPRSYAADKKNIKSPAERFFKNQIEKLKQRNFTCPFCAEELKGISSFGAHLKGHCT